MQRAFVPLTLVLVGLISISLMTKVPAQEAFYHFKYQGNAFKPYVDVLKTPNGRNILRDAPHDHLHHHALMFAIKVDHVNFWEETDDTFGKQIPEQKPLEILTTIRAEDIEKLNFHQQSLRLDWKDGNNVLLKEQRNISATQLDDANLLIWSSTFTLPEGKDKAILGGNHYHGLGMRFDSAMDKDGTFFADTSAEAEAIRGDENLTSCKWMAYTAPLEEEPVTVVIFDDPENPRPMLAFTMGDAGESFAYLGGTVNLHREPMELKNDEKISFQYGVAVMDGKQSPEKIEDLYQKWLLVVQHVVKPCAKYPAERP